jgi:hypothetical protein
MTVQLNNGIRLLSGAMFDYNNPDDSDVKIEDLAASLSKICRFSGHLWQFYSVAQHSVNASYIVPEEFAFDALMHDTSEGFTNDIPTPLKYAVPLFKELEVKIETSMAKKFGFRFPLADEVKLADSQMLMIEKLRLKKDFSEWAVLDGIDISEVEHLVDLSPWSPEEAERRFLERYEELRPK